MWLAWTLLGAAAAAAAGIPGDWQAAYDNADLLFSPKAKEAYMPEIGNGYMATRIGGTTAYLAGVFCGTTPPSKKVVSHRAAVTSPVAIKLLTATEGVMGGLHLRNGMFLERYRLQGGTLELRYYAHRERHSLFVVDFLWWSAGGGEVSVAFTPPHPETSACFSRATVNTTTVAGRTFSVWSAVTVGSEADVAPKTVSLVLPSVVQRLTLRNGTVVPYFATLRSSDDSLSPAAAAVADLVAVSEVPQSKVAEEHIEGWALLWSGGFEADRIDVARAVNASLYFILSSLRSDVHFSLSPGGLASDGYRGHSFWDCETWMYPPILAFHPVLAQSLLQYRFDRLGSAERKAKSGGFSGANFPWESAVSGNEVCDDVEAQYEQHINGDIAFAVEQYHRMTGNTTWLRGIGYPLVSKIADFWLSRITYDTNGVGHINHIQPPDEYAVNVNDSVTTNYGAAQALRFATKYAAIVGEAANPKWEQAADALAIPLDSTQDIHPEFAGYHGETVKQADTILLGYPFGMDMPPHVRTNDLNYYYSRTTATGPAMTWGIFAIGFVETGNMSLAAEAFNRSFANVKEPYQVWTETPSGGTVNFITGAGGWLQTALFGYSGLRIAEDGLHLAPQLIPGSTVNRIRQLRYRSAALDITISYSNVGIVVHNAVPITVTDLTTGRNTTTSSSTNLPLGRYRIVVPLY
eukprot:Sspe_Gene.1148::Locus_392_Transcript_1_1_Confidence_1.000_Length_2517::g.1148::m.1148/K22078/PGGHG, ATHL1; protein-glucosylgalactosylhydroxylysine glucosidase